jgi:hypothetical protein
MAVSIWMGGYAMLIADYIAISFLIVSVERLLRSGALFFLLVTVRRGVSKRLELLREVIPQFSRIALPPW